MTNLPRPTLSLKRPAPEADATSPPIRQFFFVWALDGQRPKKRHATAEAAHAEAARLRGIAPKRQFLVYEAHLLGGAP
jgi:hypothetical protein